MIRCGFPSALKNQESAAQRGEGCQAAVAEQHGLEGAGQVIGGVGISSAHRRERWGGECEARRAVEGVGAVLEDYDAILDPSRWRQRLGGALIGKAHHRRGDACPCQESRQMQYTSRECQAARNDPRRVGPPATSASRNPVSDESAATPVNRIRQVWSG